MTGWEVGLSAITVLVLVVGLANETTGLRIVTADDLSISRGVTDPVAALANRIQDLQIGRFYTGFKHAVLEWLLGMGASRVHSYLRLIPFLGAASFAGVFVGRWLDNIRVGMLTVVVTIALTPVSIGYQALLSNPVLWIGWAAVFLMGIASLDVKQGRLLAALAFTVALLVHEANAAFVVLPALIRFVRAPHQRFRDAVGWLIPCLVILTAYCFLYFGMRFYAGSTWPVEQYSGTRFSPAMGASSYSLAAYTLSGLPGFGSWLAYSPDVHGPVFLSPGEWYHRILMNLTVSGGVAMLFTGMSVWKLTHQHPTRRTDSKLGLLVLVLIYIAFAANLLIAVTTKYQIWAHQQMWPYYYTGMSYIAFAALTATAIWQMSVCDGRWSCVPRIAATVSAMILLLAVTSANHNAATLLGQWRFDHISEYRAHFVH